MGAFVQKKTDIVEVEEKWLLCPGKVIFEHPTELTSKVIAGIHV
jgi:hypothetical protein